MRRRPSTALLRLAGVATIVGLSALGVGIGTGCTLLIIAAYAVIFLARIVPAAVGWCDAKRLVEAARQEAMPAAPGWRAPEEETRGPRLVWIEPERQRLH